MKNKVWEVNVIGDRGFKAKNDFVIGSNDEGTEVVVQVGDAYVSQDKFKALAEGDLGTKVVANPGGFLPETLESIQIGDVSYKIAASGDINNVAIFSFEAAMSEEGIVPLTAPDYIGIANAIDDGKHIILRVISIEGDAPTPIEVPSIYGVAIDGGHVLVCQAFIDSSVLSVTVFINDETHDGHIEGGISELAQELWEAGTGEHSVQTKGAGCEAKSDYSVAEGWVTRTIVDETDLDTHGHASHAEGSHTIAKGACSHAEGNTTESMGMYSHAEGSGTISGGRSSHAEGDGTITENVAEHAEGSYNKSHSTNNGDIANTIHSVGIGTSMSDRKNAFEIMQNGDAYVIGVGGYDGEDIENADTLQNVLASGKEKHIILHGEMQEPEEESETMYIEIEDIDYGEIIAAVDAGKSLVFDLSVPLDGDYTFIMPATCQVAAESESGPIYQVYAISNIGIENLQANLSISYNHSEGSYDCFLAPAFEEPEGEIEKIDCQVHVNQDSTEFTFIIEPDFNELQAAYNTGKTVVLKASSDVIPNFYVYLSLASHLSLGGGEEFIFTGMFSDVNIGVTGAKEIGSGNVAWRIGVLPAVEAGDGIVVNGNRVSVNYDHVQQKLIASRGLSIAANSIGIDTSKASHGQVLTYSFNDQKPVWTTPQSGPTYTAGQNITISDAGVISVVGTQEGSGSLAIGGNAGNDGATAFGQSSLASDYYSTAIGYDAEALISASAFGHSAYATGMAAVAIGEHAVASSEGACQIGSGTNANMNTLQFKSTQIVDDNGKITADNLAGVSTATAGQVLTADGSGHVSFVTPQSGQSYTAGNLISLNDGVVAVVGNTSGYLAAAVGPYATTSAEQASAFGYNSSASGRASTAIGPSTVASQGSALAIGDLAQATNQYATAVGAGAQASRFGSLAIGFNGQTLDEYAIAVCGQATGKNSIAIGRLSVAGGENGCQIGEGENPYSNSLQFKSTMIVNYEGYIPIESLNPPASDSADGTYVLKCVKSGASYTFSWVAE